MGAKSFFAFLVFILSFEIHAQVTHLSPDSVSEQWLADGVSKVQIVVGNFEYRFEFSPGKVNFPVNVLAPRGENVPLIVASAVLEQRPTFLSSFFPSSMKYYFDKQTELLLQNANRRNRQMAVPSLVVTSNPGPLYSTTMLEPSSIAAKPFNLVSGEADPLLRQLTDAESIREINLFVADQNNTRLGLEFSSALLNCMGRGKKVTVTFLMADIERIGFDPSSSLQKLFISGFNFQRIFEGVEFYIYTKEAGMIRVGSPSYSAFVENLKLLEVQAKPRLLEIYGKNIVQVIEDIKTSAIENEARQTLLLVSSDTDQRLLVNALGGWSKVFAMNDLSKDLIMQDKGVARIVQRKNVDIEALLQRLEFSRRVLNSIFEERGKVFDSWRRDFESRISSGKR